MAEMHPTRSTLFPIDAYVDNRSLVDALHSTKLVDDRLLRITIGALQQNMASEVRSVKWIPGKDQLANCMTKRGVDGTALLLCFQSGSQVA